MTLHEPDPSSGSNLVSFLLERAIEGAGPLSSAESLSREYLGDSIYQDDEARVRALRRTGPRSSRRPNGWVWLPRGH